ncbi:MAG: hypothetical protein Q9174_002823 [Haloplaca sp. 1 TL-2023]
MTGPMDTDADVTYTPTTHRVSKAKKGKKVHVCEYQGCGKVFTRAEHRKRHEANHNPEAAFKCQVVDCQKPFQRADLLRRHMERQHEMLGSSHRSPRSLRSNSEASVDPPGGATMSHTFGQPQPVPSQPASHGSGTMSIGSIIEHSPMRNELPYHPSNMSGPGQLGIGPMPVGLRSDWVYPQIRSGDSPVYSSDSCSSPMSDYPNPHLPYQSFASHESIQRPPSTFSDESIHQGHMMSPHSAGHDYSPSWGTYDPVQTYNTAYVPTVGILGTLAGVYDICETDPDLDPAMQLSIADTATAQQHAIQQRSQSASPATLAMGPQPSLLRIHDPRTKHFLECYWQYFHPLCPIVHFPSFMSAVPQPLLAESMIVLGAQFSPRPDAKQSAASLHAACVKLMDERDPVTSHSPISDLQIVLHMEIFARYRSRSAKVENLKASTQFKSLYSSARLPNQIRRTLVAAFILEIQNRHLLQLEHSSEDPPALDELNVPFPSSSEAWGCTHLPTWRNLVLSQQAFSIDALDQELPYLDPFQSSLLTCRGIHLSLLNGHSVEHSLTYHPVKCCILPMTVTHHALKLTSCIPLHALVITASESWLFGTKVADEAAWLDAKKTLRQWVENDQALKASWHATELLRLAFGHHSSQSQQQKDQAGYLHDFWSIYVAALVCWAFGYGTTRIKSQPDSLSENAEMLTEEYLLAMKVPKWRDIENITFDTRARTKGLLEVVRVKIGEVGMGGLLDGAEDVLFRLVQGDSDLVAF